MAEKLASESRIVPLYEYDEWSEIKKAGEAASREEGYKVMEAEITALHAEVERLTAAWIPVGERLPDRYIRVLAFVKCEPHEHPHAIGFVGSLGLWSLDELHEPSAAVTHWMPLPEPPETK